MKRDALLGYLILFLSFITLSPLKYFTSDYFLLGFFLFLLIIYVKRGEHVDPFVIFILLSLFVINFIAELVWENNNFIVVLGTALRIVIVYLSLRILGSEYWSKYLNIVIVLAVMSVPFYLVQLIYPQLFISLYPYFSWLDSDLRQSSGKYGFIFHVVHIGYEYRNSGFAVEPGIFGYFLGLGIILQLLKNGMKIDRYIIIVSLIGITTFSTSFYLFLWLTLTFIFIYKKNPLLYLINIPLIILLAFYFYNLDFVTDKIIFTYDIAWNTYEKGYQHSSAEGLNRVGGLILDLDDFFTYPFGYGNAIGERYTWDGLMISSPNGFGRFVRSYGIVGLVMLFIALRRASIYFSLNRHFSLTSLGLTLSLLIFLFSNPIERDPFLLAFLFTPFILKVIPPYARFVSE